jgi:3'-phosphoadenosine 5'-phosphosulfate sulfotransferase (PAPS reductase)/FAD synthetase
VEYYELRQRQSLPLEAKVIHSQNVIRQAYEHWDGNVSVSFSGGKDSTVLLSLVRELYPEVPAVFVDTGLEYPEIRDFVKTIDNVIWVKPKMRFDEVISKYGYPVISKRTAQYLHEIKTPTERNAATIRLRLTGIRNSGEYSRMSVIPEKWRYLINAPFKISDQCCDVMKKRPLDTYVRETGRNPYVGTMACEANTRILDYLKDGCNAFRKKRPASRPLSIWLENDIWTYIKQNNIAYSNIYDQGEVRTGCMFCAFGVHLEKNPNRFQRMSTSHPKQYQYCINQLGLGEVLDYLKVAY